MRRKLFPMISAKLAYYDMGYAEMARRIGIHANTLSARMNGHQEWTLDEEYKVLDLFNEPDEMLHKYFPRRSTK